MGASTDALMNLRPVTFKYKNDERGTTQYGLIAEEVENVYPELVTYDADGELETVRYSMLTSMLLNEIQKQSAELQKQKSENAIQAEQMQEMARRTATLEQRLSMMEQAMASRRSIASTAFDDR